MQFAELMILHTSICLKLIYQLGYLTHKVIGIINDEEATAAERLDAGQADQR
jgi:hypothetical protein